MKAEIKAAEEKCNGLNGKLEDKKKIVNAEYEAKVARRYADRKKIFGQRNNRYIGT